MKNLVNFNDGIVFRGNTERIAKVLKKAENKEAVKNVIKVTRGHVFDDGSVAFDMEVNGVSIYNSTLREGKNGLFVSFPSRKAKDGKYYSHVYVKLSEEDVADIIEQLETL